MALPRAHIVSASKETSQRLVKAIGELDSKVVCIEHLSNESFLDYMEAPRPAIWELVVTDLVKLNMPSGTVGKFMPVVHFFDDPATDQAQCNCRSSHSRVVLHEIQGHLKDAMASAKQFVRLKSGVLKLSHLDDRERSIVKMAADGIPNKTMANRLKVSIKTIEHCRRKAYAKLEVASLAEVASLVTFHKFFSLFDVPCGSLGGSVGDSLGGSINGSVGMGDAISVS